MSGITYTPLKRSEGEFRLLVLQGLSRDAKHKSTEGRQGPSEVPDKPYYHVALDLPGSSSKVQKWLRALKGTRTKPTAYCALSYVWGDPARVCDIKIDGFTVKIAKNLHAALTSIWKNTRIRFIWADAICINQEDNDEKSWQVRDMRTIYRRAHTVISWLGPGTPAMRHTLSDIAILQQKHDQDEAEGRNIDVYPPWKVQAYQDYFREVDDDADRWNALLELMNSPYWTRMWIFQELASARKRLFLCGDVSVENLQHMLLRIIQQAGSNFGPAGAPPGGPSDKLMATKASSMVWTMKNYEYHQRNSGSFTKRPLLIDLLRSLHHLQCSDGRDIVYALISIADDGRRKIAPDYTLPTEVVFTQTATAMMLDNYIDILLDAIRLPGRPQLPTWVPNWEAVTARDHLEIDLMFRHDLCPLEIKQTSIKPQVSLSKLTLECYIVDEVMSIGLAEVKGNSEAMQRVEMFQQESKVAIPFRSVTGYFGLCAHEDCKAGDLLVIVPKIQVPLTLRKTDTRGEPKLYWLISMAYIHGIMDGEFFKELREPQNVVLC